MTESTNRIPKAKNWADEIDDLYHDATVRHLKAAFFAQTPKRAANAGGADQRPPSGTSVQHESSIGGVPL